MIRCAYAPCGIEFEPKRPGHRFHTDACRAAYHREQHLPGVVAGQRELRSGGWSVTIRYPTQPTGLRIGTRVRLETEPAPRTDADGRANAGGVEE